MSKLKLLYQKKCFDEKMSLKICLSKNAFQNISVKNCLNPKMSQSKMSQSKNVSIKKCLNQKMSITKMHQNASVKKVFIKKCLRKPFF